jgi:hypothetical protein
METMRRLLDAVLFAGSIVVGPLSRWPVRPIGDESRRPLPGDDVLPGAKGHWTNAITIRGRPADIWPWLAQMGCRRAGWYSYDGLDNGGVRSAAEIISELQRVEVGDLFAGTPGAHDGFFVEEVEPERTLVLTASAGNLYRAAWAFVLEPVDDRTTRLITRSSGDYERRSVGVGLRLIGHPIHFAMQRKQLLNIRRHVETATPSAV